MYDVSSMRNISRWNIGRLACRGLRNYFVNHAVINQLRFNGVYYVTRQNNTRNSAGRANGNTFARHRTQPKSRARTPSVQSASLIISYVITSAPVFYTAHHLGPVIRAIRGESTKTLVRAARLNAICVNVTERDDDSVEQNFSFSSQVISQLCG